MLITKKLKEKIAKHSSNIDNQSVLLDDASFNVIMNKQHSK